MKRSFLKYVFLVGIFVLAGICSCQDNDIVKLNRYDIVEGIPVQVTLKYGVPESVEVTTRTAQSEETERTIYRLYVIAFNEDGSVSGRNSYENVNNDTGSGTIEDFTMTSGNNKQIFIVGNPNSGVGTLNVDALRNVQSLDEFEALASQLTNPLNIERRAFLMVGQMKNKDGEMQIAVDEDGIILNASNDPVPLERVDARITFRVKVDNPDYSNFVFVPKYYQVKNIPQGTYLLPREKVSMPDGKYYDYAEAMEAQQPGSGYASMESNTERLYFDGEKDFEDGQGTWHYFEFYLPENRLKPRNEIKSDESQRGDISDYYADASSLYALREKKEKGKQISDSSKPGQVYEQGPYVFANEHSTYVEIYGNLSYEYKGQFVHANVIYTVHLGNTGNTSSNGSGYENEETLVNNYDTERNTHYIYSVTITGVESMRVEVVAETPKETRPGVEGSVIVAGGEVRSVDAHYCRDLITLSREEILDGLSWAISTPFQSGMKVFDTEMVNDVIDGNRPESDLQTDASLNDYKWVKFGINKEYPFIDFKEEHFGHPDEYNHDNYYCRLDVLKYPGEDAYDGGDGLMNGGGTSAPAFGISDEDAPFSAYYNNRVKLYDVNQLLNHLYREAKDSGSTIFDEDGTVTISVFIDEYLYVYDPTKEYYQKPIAVDVDGVISDEDLMLWKKVVNGDNRMLHICKSGAKYSPDGQTSWAESVVTISQSPIYTFYNADESLTELESAWGTESIMEVGDSKYPTGELSIGTNLDFGGNTTTDNGRKNTLNILNQKELKWSDIVSVYTKAPDLRDGYRNIWYACLLRNRDLDGDDVVDPEEIRWYLASIDQLTDLWIGEDAIPNAKLYNKEVQNGVVTISHVASSSYYSGSPSNPWIIWAEEGASRGSYNGDDYKDKISDAYAYRCVRNLGLKLQYANDEIPVYQDYVKENLPSQPHVANGETYTERVIDVSYMDAVCVRPASVDTPLPKMTERDSYRNNRPYWRFAVIESATDDSDGLYHPSSTGHSSYDDYGYGDWIVYYDNERNGYPCPTGYRIPNQRELMLLYTTYPELFTNQYPSYITEQDKNAIYMCKTAFSFKDYKPYSDQTISNWSWNDNNHSRIGFAYQSGNLFLLNYSVYLDSYKMSVRCVRDMVE